MAAKFSYVGQFSDSGSKNSFYRLKGKPYGFKSFPNKSLAEFAHAVQSHLAPYLAPKVYSVVCRIRVPNYFVDGIKNNKIKYRTEMVLSDWGYLTEIAKPFVCKTRDCEGACMDSGYCPNYSVLSDLLYSMNQYGVEYADCHEGNFGYVQRGRYKVLVPIDFGRESVGYTDDGMFPEVCWDGAEDTCCDCENCQNKYEESEYV